MDLLLGVVKQLAPEQESAAPLVSGSPQLSQTQATDSNTSSAATSAAKIDLDSSHAMNVSVSKRVGAIEQRLSVSAVTRPVSLEAHSRPVPEDTQPSLAAHPMNPVPSSQSGVGASCTEDLRDDLKRYLQLISDGAPSCVTEELLRSIKARALHSAPVTPPAPSFLPSEGPSLSVLCFSVPSDPLAAAQPVKVVDTAQKEDKGPAVDNVVTSLSVIEHLPEAVSSNLLPATEPACIDRPSFTTSSPGSFVSDCSAARAQTPASGTAIFGAPFGEVQAPSKQVSSCTPGVLVSEWWFPNLVCLNCTPTSTRGYCCCFHTLKLHFRFVLVVSCEDHESTGRYQKYHTNDSTNGEGCAPEVQGGYGVSRYKYKGAVES